MDVLFKISIVFGIALSVAKLSVGKAEHSLFEMLSEPIIEIGGSILLQSQ
ncbi:MAG: hypothetical protein GX913_01430 [Clostridiales bacterium]|nr:hypothetical protein [Clostridiales bacterium]